MARSAERQLNLKEVARHLDVHYMTVYRYVRTGRLPARRNGNVWMVSAGDLERFEAIETTEVMDLDDARNTADWERRMRDRLVLGDEPGAWATAESMLASGHDASAVLAVVSAAVASSGEDGGIVGSFLAVNTAQRTISVLAGRFRRSGRVRGTVVLGAPGAEGHGFALGTLAVALRLENFQVLELGTGVPPAAFVEAGERAAPVTAIGIGVTTVERLSDAVEVIELVRRDLPDVPVVLGGQAVRNREVAAVTGADAWASGAAELVEVVTGLPRRRRPVVESSDLV